MNDSSITLDQLVTDEVLNTEMADFLRSRIGSR